MSSISIGKIKAKITILISTLTVTDASIEHVGDMIRVFPADGDPQRLKALQREWHWLCDKRDSTKDELEFYQQELIGYENKVAGDIKNWRKWPW